MTAVGQIREASDATLLSLQDLGKGSVAHLTQGNVGPPLDRRRSANEQKARLIYRIVKPSRWLSLA